ncbi:MAG: hypothetical protein R3330_09845 [Saprospiraceae bacterium]|nr:hypothetical protein [Saprospiraceae bacterium]
MKRLAKNAMALLFCTAAFATGTLAEKCDRLVSYDLGIVKESVEADLINGTWTTDLNGNPSSMYFHADGSVETFRKDRKKDIVEVATWEVRMESGEMILTLTAPDGTSRSMRINPTCEGFAAMDAFGSAVDLYKVNDYNQYVHHQIKRQITGEWSAMAQSDLNVARNIHWDFAADGTFELAVGPDAYHSTHQGVWDVAPTGEYIILYFTNRDNPESVYAMELLKVRSVDFEDLVLDGKFMPRMLAEFANGKTMHFEKSFDL